MDTPEQWAAVSLLDRTCAQDSGGPERHRALLDAALEAAHRAGDGVAVARAEGEIALLDAVEAARH